MSSEAAQKAGGVAMSTRDELIADLSREEHAPMSDHDPRDGSCRSWPWPVYMLGPNHIADALIAEGWRKKPSRQEIAEALVETHGWEFASGSRDAFDGADAVLALMDRGQ